LDQGIGKKVTQSLKTAASRGVTVHLVVDGIGSKHCLIDFSMIFESGHPGDFLSSVQSLFRLGNVLFRRLHQKIVVIDEELAFVGGINIDPDQYHQLDFAVSVSGPLAPKDSQICETFVLRFWETGFNIFKREGRIRPSWTKRQRPGRLIVRDNLRHRRRLKRLIF